MEYRSLPYGDWRDAENMIRSIAQADVPDLAAVYMSSFRNADPSEQWTVQRAQELIECFLRIQPDMAFIAIHDDAVAGGIFGLVKPWWDGNHLVDTELFVSPDFQGQGLGAQLLRHFLKRGLEAHAARSIEAITFADMEFPGSWYARIGFEDKPDWKVIVGDVATVVEQLESPRRSS